MLTRYVWPQLGLGQGQLSQESAGHGQTWVVMIRACQNTWETKTQWRRRGISVRGGLVCEPEGGPVHLFGTSKWLTHAVEIIPRSAITLRHGQVIGLVGPGLRGLCGLGFDRHAFRLCERLWLWRAGSAGAAASSVSSKSGSGRVLGPAKKAATVSAASSARSAQAFLSKAVASAGILLGARGRRFRRCARAARRARVLGLGRSAM